MACTVITIYNFAKQKPTVFIIGKMCSSCGHVYLAAVAQLRTTRFSPRNAECVFLVCVRFLDAIALSSTECRLVSVHAYGPVFISLSETANPVLSPEGVTRQVFLHRHSSPQKTATVCHSVQLTTVYPDGGIARGFPQALPEVVLCLKTGHDPTLNCLPWKGYPVKHGRIMPKLVTVILRPRGYASCHSNYHMSHGSTRDTTRLL
jgi:hypothetical protein